MGSRARYLKKFSASTLIVGLFLNSVATLALDQKNSDTHHSMPNAETATLEEIKAYYHQKGKKVVDFLGYSAAEYQDKRRMLEIAHQVLSQYDPKNTVVLIGGTTQGIGAIYPDAEASGFDTEGIVSELAKKYGGLSPSCHHTFYVHDQSWGGFKSGTTELNPTSEAIVSVSDKVVGIGGGEVGRDELLASLSEGKDVSFFPADMNHEIAIQKALKAGASQPTDFSGAADLAIRDAKNSQLAALLRQIGQATKSAGCIEAVLKKATQ